MLWVGCAKSIPKQSIAAEAASCNSVVNVGRGETATPPPQEGHSCPMLRVGCAKCIAEQSIAAEAASYDCGMLVLCHLLSGLTLNVTL